MIDYRRTAWEDIPDHVLDGLYKEINPWSRVLDSTSADGLFHLSTKLQRPESFSVMLYPNPLISHGAPARINLDISLPRPGMIDISILDMRGTTAAADHVDGLPFGRQTVSLPLPELPAGIYYVMIRYGESIAVVPLRMIR